MQDLYSQLSDSQKTINQEIFDIIVGRILVAAQDRLSDDDRRNAEAVLQTGTEEEKQECLIRYIPDFPELFKKEFEKLASELDEQLEK